MTNIIFLFIAVLISCTNSPEKETSKLKLKTDSKFYTDINIYKLEGVSELKEISYPCIEIQNFDKKKIVTYHVSSQRNSTNEYFYVGSAWVSKSQSRGDTSMIYFFEFVLPDKVISFNYSDTNRFNLMDASLVSGNKEVTYTFGRSNQLFITPEPDNFGIVAKKAETKFILEVNDKDSVFSVLDKEFNKQGELVSSKNSCYQSKKRSFYWWQVFGATYLRKIECYSSGF